MDISSLVRAVIAAFEDAAKLVNRIRDQRETSASGPLPHEPTRDLLESLTLGPVIVRGHYEHDLKRFGEPYACGDIQAREQMKDVLINLQMTLIITLRSVWMDDMELDFLALQTSSDDCRVNAGVCLGQLSQRLSDAAKAQSLYTQNMSAYSSGSGLMAPMSPSLGYSSSRSTHSSGAFQTPRTPDPMVEQFSNLNISSPVRPPYIDRKMSTSSGGSQDIYTRQTTTVPRPAAVNEFQGLAPSVGVHRIDESDAISMRRRSSQALAPDDNILLLFPKPGGQPNLPSPAGQDTDRDSYVSSGKNSQTYSPPDLSRASSGHQSQNSRERFGPDDYGEQAIRMDGRQFSYGTIYDMYQPGTPEKQAPTSFSQRAQASNNTNFDHIRYLQENSRPPRPQPRSDSLNSTSKNATYTQEGYRRPARSPTSASSLQPYQARLPLSAPIPVDSLHESRPAFPPAQQSVAAKHLSPTLLPSNRTASIHTTASSAPSLPPVPLGPLILPTDKSLLGFCKGAFRLQAGLERKAFTVANRPAGFSGMIAYWRCEKCNFEGPVHNTVVIAEGKKKGKPEKSFDPRVRISESGGIRYRWAFLARCHVPLKGMVPTDTHVGREGGFGSFGCIFCCAEGKNRGWLDPSTSAGSLKGSNASVKSGHTANTAVKVGDGSSVPTPIFGNVSSFMQHLENVHRPQDGWPNAEMLGRFKVVVGRVAPQDEEGWDLNFLP